MGTVSSPASRYEPRSRPFREAALAPLLQRLPDTNPRLLMRYEIPEATRCAVIEDGEQDTVVVDVGFPYFGQLIQDCLHRTENAMTQAHTFKAAELCVKAQMLANAVE